jgi:hypothetical protein
MDEGTHQLLERAVVGVEPKRGLDDVKGRARQRHARGRLLAGVTAAIVAIVGVGGVIAILNDEAPNPYIGVSASPSDKSQQAAALQAKIDRALLELESLNERVALDVHQLRVAKQHGILLAARRLSARLEVERADVARVEALMRHLMDRLHRLLVAPSGSPGPGTETTQSAAGIQVTYPPGWFMHDGRDLALVSPSVAFVVGSWNFPTGGDCAPSAAVTSIPRDGVLLWVVEYVIPDRPADFEQRPATFDLGRLKGPFECVGESAYVVLFRDSGRFFQVQVVLGPDAGEAGKQAAEQVLDSMVVSRSA